MIEKFPTENVEKSTGLLKRSMRSYLLFKFNFPDEAISAITNLAIAMEALLCQWSIENGLYQRDAGQDFYLGFGIESYKSWGPKQRKLAKWLRDKRNALVHPNEVTWERREFVEAQLKEIYPLVGGLYISLGYDLADVFTSAERRILQGRYPSWETQAITWAEEAVAICSKDPETALQMANEALEKALMAFAYAWRFDPHYFLPGNKTKFVSGQDSWDDAREYWYQYPYYDGYDMYINASPYYKLPELYEEKYIGTDIKLQATMEDVMQLRNAYAGNLARELKIYLQEVKGAIDYLMDSAPCLDIFECLLKNIDQILEDVSRQFPGASIPEVKEIGAEWDKGKHIYIYTQNRLENYGWPEEEKYMPVLLNVIKETCGELPQSLYLHIGIGLVI